MEQSLRSSLTERNTPLDLLEYSRELMRKGSLSFFLASRFLPSQKRSAIYFLYAWCRFTDDFIDESDDQSPAELKGRVETLRSWTRSAHAGDPPEIPAFKAMAALCHDYQIPLDYPLALLEGMEMDATAHRYRSFEELWRYCYAVAGAVGLMTCHIFGLRSDAGLVHADAMGRAMQLTNIARDLITDARLGRVYVPDSWFPEKPLTAEEMLAPENRKLVQTISSRLLSYADACYRNGEKGINDLPWQVGFAVSSARWIYSAIGVRIKSKGIHAWDSRAWVPFSQKVGFVIRAALVMVQMIPYRLRNPWRPKAIRRIHMSNDLKIIEEGSKIIVRH